MQEIVDYIKEAFSLKTQGLYKPAVEMLYKALSLDNDNAEVLFQLGEIYALMHNYQRAAGYLEQVLAKNPEHRESLNLIQKIFEKQNNYEKALEFAQKIFDFDKNSKNLQEIVKLSGKLHLTDKFSEYIDSPYCDLDVIYEIAKALYENNKSSDAKKLLQNCQENNDNINILLGKIYFDEGNIDGAKSILKKYNSMSDNPEILNYLGLFALDDMNFTEAVKYFSKASAINKNCAVYFYNLANAYFFNGWMDEAQKAYSKAIYLAPDNIDYRYSLAYLYYEINAFDKCKKETDAILALNPNYCHANVLKALLLNNQNEFMQAKNILENNLKNYPDDEFTLLSLSKTYVCLDMFEKAEKTILLVKSSENLNRISDLADIYIKEKKFDEALELADKIIGINPNYVYGYVLGAKISYLKGDFDKSKEYAQNALSLDINCSEGYYYLALVRLNENDYEEAIECMKRAITYDISNPKYYAEMSNIYKLKGDIKTAFDYISEAESIDNSEEYKIRYKELAALNRKK